jgi:uncharacterized membrane protein YfcA
MESVSEFLTQGTGLTMWAFAGLCAVSFLGSFIAGALGLGGGLLVLASMTLVLPPTALIPLHGLVQLGSNGFRAFLLRRAIAFRILPAFLIGSMIGSFIGGRTVVALETWLLQLILGLFVLYATWAPGFRSRAPGPAKFLGAGAFSGFATMFIGGSGPLVAPFVAAACPERQQMVATHATLMTCQHTFKIIAFGFLGFAFGAYWPLLVGLLAFGAAGTYVGGKALDLLPERAFRIGLKAILTLLGLRMLYAAAMHFLD